MHLVSAVELAGRGAAAAFSWMKQLVRLPVWRAMPCSACVHSRHLQKTALHALKHILRA
jgi:hypothetical protein